MEQRFETKTKLLIPIFILVSVLIFLAAVIIQSYSSKINSLVALNEKISLSRNVSALIHSLQKERGLSSGYITNYNGKFTRDMLKQRKISDDYIKKLFVEFDQIKCENLKKNIFLIRKNLNSLFEIRKLIDTHKYTPNEVIQKYSNINTLLLDMIVNIAKTSHIPSITQNILAYSYLLSYKEDLGIERAQGVILLSLDKFDKESFTNFVTIMAIAKHNELIFLKYASKSLKDYYLKHSKIKIFTEVDTLEKKILSNQQDMYSVQAKEWYTYMTQKLNILDNISQYIEKTTQQQIKKELDDAKLFFIIIVILLIASWILFVYVVVHLLKLIKNEQRLRLVMDKYIISSSTDLKGIIIDASQAFCTISGYNKKELIGKNHNIVRHPDMPKETFAELWKQIKEGKSWSGKVKNRRKDGGFYWVYANIDPLYNADNEIDSYISVRMDITENELLNQKIQKEEEKIKRQEEIMQQQHRLAQMGEMIAMIAHQWRQPLSAITAASVAISVKASRDKLDAQTAIELSTKIQEFSRHLSMTIDDFRNFFKSNKQKTSTDFKKISENVLSILEDSLKKNNIEVSCQYENVEEFVSYEGELKQVLLNLIKNSEDALIENNISEKKIMLIINKKCLQICDNAGGIDDTILSKIFDPYFSTKTKKDGTGLGLYMSKVIVEDHCNGILKVNNTIDGAMFEIILGDNDDE